MLENLFRNMTDVVKNLLLLNVVMFVLTLAIPETYDLLALRYFDSPSFEPYQIVSHFFLHAGIAHLLFNMFGLVMFGSQLERIWGPKRFLLFYFISAFGAFILHMIITYFQLYPQLELISEYNNTQSIEVFNTYIADYFTPHASYISKQDPKYVEEIYSLQNSINNGIIYSNTSDVMQGIYYSHTNTTLRGASGAIMGLFAAFAYLFPNSEIMLIFLPIPIKAKYFMPVYMIIELFLGVGNFQWDNIAHFAHLGGALAGFIMVYIWQKNKTRMY